MSNEAGYKALTIAGIPVLVFTVMFKFAPDLAIATIQHGTSLLTGYDVYRSELNGIHASRFAANAIVLGLAHGIEAVIGVPSDIRMHPLRLAAAVVATISIGLTIVPLMFGRQARVWSWSRFSLHYLPAVVLSLQIYKPYDLTSTTLIGVGLIALAMDRFDVALLLVPICGLFRESSLHIVWFAVCFASLRGGRSRLAITVAMGVVWAVELAIIRHVWGVTAMPHGLGIPPDIRSPSLWVSVAAAGILAGIAALDLRERAHLVQSNGARVMERFFRWQLFAVPAWMIFYKVSGGGLAEFRLLLPVLLPLSFSVAWQGVDPQQEQISVRPFASDTATAADRKSPRVMNVR